MSFVNFRSLGCGTLLLLLAGCGNNSLQCVDQSSQDEADPFKNVQVEIGVDGSASMLGYVKEKNTRYSQAIETFSTLLANQLVTNKPIPTRFWRIGSNKNNVVEAQKLSSTDFLIAKTGKFYPGCPKNLVSPNENTTFSSSTVSFPCVGSTLQQIYDVGDANPKQETLRILITDLEPNNAAVESLVNSISKELKAHPDYKAVLLGVRSQYSGAIFIADEPDKKADLDNKPETKDDRYETVDKDLDQEGRPFYVLMTGPSAAVDRIIDGFQSFGRDVNKALRASSFAIAGGDTLVMDKSKVPDKLDECIEQTGSINRQRPKGNQEEQWLFLEQSCNGKPLELTLPSQKSVILAGSEKLTPESFESSNQAVTIEDVKDLGNQLALTLLLDRTKFSQKKGEFITITLKKRALDDATWDGWDTDTKAPEGSKTQNLDYFIRGLRNSVENAVQGNQQKEAAQEAVKYCLGFARYDKDQDKK